MWDIGHYNVYSPSSISAIQPLGELIADGKPPMTLGEIEGYFENISSLYFEGANIKNTSPYFIIPRVQTYQELFNIVDSQTGKVVVSCESHKNISVHDSFRIFKYYSPEATFGDLLEIYRYSMVTKELSYGIVCPQIKRRVFKFETTSQYFDHDHFYREKDEFGHTVFSLLSLGLLK